MTTFVGRTKELRALARVIATSAGPSAALITGVPGCGKSRLIAEARQSASDVPAFTVIGFEPERQIPLAAAAGLLRALVSVPGHGEVLDALLFGSVPELSAEEGRPDFVGPFEPLRIFEAARRALRSTEPAVLVIDDLQWVDDLSLLLCRYLMRAAVESKQRIAIIGAVRTGGPGEELFDSLPPARVQQIDLAALDQEEGRALAIGLDPSLDAASADRLWRRAQGIPFWVEGLVLYGQGEAGLQQILTRRLRGAGTDAARLLGTLALAGRPLSMAAAAELLDREPERVEAALDTLVARGLARAEGGIWQPAHDLIRAAAAAQFPEETRRRIHGRLAARFEQEAGGDLQLLRLALGHRRAAGLSVLALAGRLATSPRRRLLGTDGAEELGVVADEAEPLAPETIALQSNVAALLFELGEHEHALIRWALVSERAQVPATRASAALSASKAAYALARTTEAREWLSRSRDLLADDPVLALEQSTHEAAICLWLEQRGPEGRALARDVVSVARELAAKVGRPGRGKPRLRRALLDALRVEYEAAMQQGDIDGLLRTAEERESAARGVGIEEVLEASLALGVALRLTGQVRQAVARFRRAWAETQRVVLPRLTVDAGFWLGRTLAVMCELAEAEAVVRDTGELVQRVGDVPRARHRIARVAAGVWLERGQVARAVNLLEQEIAREANAHQRIVLHGDRALWAARLDGPAAAGTVQAHLEAAESCAAAAGCPRCTGELLMLMAEAWSRVADDGSARAALQRRDRLEFPLDDFDRLARAHAIALATTGLEERVAAFQAALSAAVSSPYRLTELWIRLDFGRSLAAMGDERAVTELDHVAIAAEGCGADTVRALAGRSLHGLGVRTWRRGSGGTPLTAREAEVARLVAAGATNREVASTLFISTKTVERHLVNLYQKLDVRNRTELAAHLGNDRAETYGISPMTRRARRP